MMKSQLGQGAAVSVLVRSPHPSPQYYVIERIYGAKPRVRDHNGDLLDGVAPLAILGNIEVYGQHEISELTRQPAKLAELLRRFTEPIADTSADKGEIQLALENRGRACWRRWARSRGSRKHLQRCLRFASD